MPPTPARGSTGLRYHRSMLVLVLMLAVGLAMLTQVHEAEATIAISVWCAVVGLMLVLTWQRRMQRRRSADTSRSLLELDGKQRRLPPDR